MNKLLVLLISSVVCNDSPDPNPNFSEGSFPEEFPLLKEENELLLQNEDGSWTDNFLKPFQEEV